MLRVRAFRGVRAASPLGRFICPPYDVIAPSLAERLRRRGENAIRLELPEGTPATRYRNAAALWRRWLAEGVLAPDPRRAFYLVEQRFRLEGRWRRRVGLLAELGLEPASDRRVLRHEKTLAKPKKDRTKLLAALQVNTSPIFAVYPDKGGAVRRVLEAAARRRPDAAGTDVQGVRYRLWRIDRPEEVAKLERAFRAKKLLIADGHHRHEVARRHWLKTRRPGADALLAYLCAEEDPGLFVSPTHRVVAPSAAVEKAVGRACRGRAVAPARLPAALRAAASPYAFGLYNGDCRLMAPALGDKGVRSRFGADWLARRILKSVDAHDIRYFHDEAEAMREARASGWTAFLLKPFSVTDIRKAVEKAGLLPQKSTYFIPKIATGLVFRPLKP